MGGHRAKNFSWLLGTLLICCSCMVVAFSKAEHQHQQQTVTPSDTDATESTDEDDKELPLFESYLDPGCEMVNFNESGETEISMDDYVFQPVIYLTYTTASIKIKTDSNQYYNLNTTHLPTQRLMSARFDPQTASFKITLAHTLEEVNLNVTGVDDIEGLNITAMTFKYINMTDGNCTNGLPFFKGIDAFVRIPHRERRDLLLLSTRDEGDRSDISGRTSSDYFWICNDVGGITTIKTRFWREGDEFPEDCTSIKANIPHRLTLTYNDDTEIIKMNYTVETGSTGWVQFTGGNYTMVYCLTLCPTSTELTTQPGAVAVGVSANESLKPKNFSSVETTQNPTIQDDDVYPTTSSGKFTGKAMKRKVTSPKLPETKETLELTTAQLQRLVLLEQLKLIRLQQQEILERKERITTDMDANKAYFNL